MLGGSLHTINKNTEALVVFSKETGLEVNADKTKYVAVSREQNAGKCHNIKRIGRREEFKYLGTNLKYQNSIQEENKSRLNSGNACCHLVLNILSSNVLSKKYKN
jgi:hypothetical protein